MNYKIIGGDGKEYGPITLEQMRQWLTEGRVNAQTQVQREGATDWQPLSAFPELTPLTAQSAGPVPDTSPETALTMIKGPATGVLVTGILGGVLAVAGIGARVLGLTFMQGFGMQGGNPAQEAINKIVGGASVIQGLLHLAVAGFIIYGALQMKKLVNHRLAMATAIVALVPCLSPCCLLGMPFGIWALVVLNKPEVKSTFQ
jgi:hypothetical protein